MCDKREKNVFTFLIRISPCMCFVRQVFFGNTDFYKASLFELN